MGSAFVKEAPEAVRLAGPGAQMSRRAMQR